MLLWSAVISLLDQLSSGQVIVYAVGLVAVSVTPVIHPRKNIAIYVCAHAFFCALLPFFQKSPTMLFGNYVNSTAFAVISPLISFLLYKTVVNEFCGKKTIEEKNYELSRLNEELEATNRKLFVLSRTDSLTGIANRFGFDEKVAEKWEACLRRSSPLSLLMFDVDSFKEYNDNYGHIQGDECLKLVASAIKKAVEDKPALAARYGGDEFAVLLEGDELSSRKLTADFKTELERKAIPHNFSRFSKIVTVCLGSCTAVPSDKSTPAGFIKNADTALYKAKALRVCV